jgi:hypothetical protein
MKFRYLGIVTNNNLIRWEINSRLTQVMLLTIQFRTLPSCLSKNVKIKMYKP